MASRPEHLNARVPWLNTAWFSAGKMDRDHLTSNGVTVLHSRGPDLKLLHLEVTCQSTEKLGMRQTLFLQEQIEMLPFTRWLVQGILLDEKVLFASLDVAGNVR